VKIAVLSDIHGNIGALDAVLEDARSRGVDRIVNLGDILSGALFPRETAERLMPLDLPTIRGNHERQVTDQPYERMEPSDRYAADTLTPEQLSWIAALPATMRLEPDVLMVHGTPDSDLGYFLDTVEPAGARAATPDEVSERAGGAQAALNLCGHTHVPRVMRLPDGRLVANPGSVGLPAYSARHPWPHKAETGTPHARYAVVTRRAEGWTAELLAVAYDWESAARTADTNGRPEWSHALLTGRAT
jgi:predicted phosphodiesterase